MVNITTTPYDLVNISNSNDMLEFIRNVNHLTGQYFMFGFLIAGFVIMFISVRYSQQYTDNKGALLVSNFVTVILGIMFLTLDFISSSQMIILVLGFGTIFTFSMLKSND